jgi:hypothetical protein
VTYIYYNKEGKLRGMEKGNFDSTPIDEGSGGYYPSRAWIDSAGMDMRHTYNKGKI